MGNETLLLVSKWGGDTLLYQLNQFWFRKGCEEFFLKSFYYCTFCDLGSDFFGKDK